MPLGAGVPDHRRRNRLAFGIGKCCIQQLTFILLFAVPWPAIFGLMGGDEDFYICLFYNATYLKKLKLPHWALF